jgi:hypothetical protein
MGTEIMSVYKAGDLVVPAHSWVRIPEARDQPLIVLEVLESKITDANGYAFIDTNIYACWSMLLSLKFYIAHTDLKPYRK